MEKSRSLLWYITYQRTQRLLWLWQHGCSRAENKVQRPLNYACRFSWPWSTKLVHHWSLQSKCRWNESHPLPYGESFCSLFDMMTTLSIVSLRHNGLSDSSRYWYKAEEYFARKLGDIENVALLTPLSIMPLRANYIMRFLRYRLCGERRARNLIARSIYRSYKVPSILWWLHRWLKQRRCPNSRWNQDISNDYLPKPFPYV